MKFAHLLILLSITLNIVVPYKNYADEVFFAGFIDGEEGIYKSDLSNLKPEQIADISDRFVDIDLDWLNKKIYGLTFSRDVIRMNFDGSGLETLGNIPSSYHFVVSSESAELFFYIIDNSSNRKIEAYNLNLADKKTIYTSNKNYGFDTGGFAVQIYLDSKNKKLYWTDGLMNSVKRSNLDGSELEDIITDLRFPGPIAVDPYAKLIFLRASGLNHIGVFNLRGTYLYSIEVDPPNIPPSQGAILELDTINQHIYWQGYRSQYDGQNIERVIESGEIAILIDQCPNDENKIDPCFCGCGVSDVDLDQDGFPDCNGNGKVEIQENYQPHIAVIKKVIQRKRKNIYRVLFQRFKRPDSANKGKVKYKYQIGRSSLDAGRMINKSTTRRSVRIKVRSDKEAELRYKASFKKAVQTDYSSTLKLNNS